MSLEMNLNQIWVFKSEAGVDNIKYLLVQQPWLQGLIRPFPRTKGRYIDQEKNFLLDGKFTDRDSDMPRRLRNL